MNDYKSIIERLSAENLCLYLDTRGWQRLPDLFGGKVRQFQSGDDGDVVLVPISRNFTDYYREVRETLNIIAHTEGKTFYELTNKLLNPSQDILKWRIADELTNKGAIPFNSMTENIEHIKDLLASAILDITTPSKIHSRLYTKEVNIQISQYQFGQTEIGSYILNILCPLGYYQHKLFNPEVEDIPLSRRVNLQILNGIHTIQTSIKVNSSELQDVIDEGKISVNFLTALTKIYEENSKSDVSIKVDWNVDVPLLTNTHISHVELNPNCYEPLLIVIEKNSPQQEQTTEKSYCGKISSISGDAEIESRETITVVVAAIDDDMRKINVKVELNYQKYFPIVTDAFETGANVIVTGTLIKTAKSTKLSDARIHCIQEDK